MKTINDLECQARVILGDTTINLKSVDQLGEGSFLVLNQAAGGFVTVEINGRPCFEGEVVAIDNQFGVRISREL